MAAVVTMNVNSRERDEFLKVLEEARRAAMPGSRPSGRVDEPSQRPSRPARLHIDFRQAVDRIAGTLRSYISAGLVSRLYAEGAQLRPKEIFRRAPARSEHAQILGELHLTPSLTAHDLKLIRRRFAMANHPDRVAPDIREQATRRMTIANSLIDEALRGTRARTP